MLKGANCLTYVVPAPPSFPFHFSLATVQ